MTKHRVLYSLGQDGTDEIPNMGEVWWYTIYDVLECLGCEAVMLRRKHMFSETQEEEVSFFPPRVSIFLPEWQWKLPNEIRAVMQETYTALQADSRRLALMGARAIIERTMVLTAGDAGTFGANLKQFEDQGYLSKHNRKFLEVALEAGHAASHRAHQATPELNRHSHGHRREPYSQRLCPGEGCREDSERHSHAR